LLLHIEPHSSSSIADAELQTVFGKFGKVTIERSNNGRCDSHLLYWPLSSLACSFAILTYESTANANSAVAAKPTLADGREIRVEAEDPNARNKRAPRSVTCSLPGH
jgi:hypothetical protein